MTIKLVKQKLANFLTDPFVQLMVKIFMLIMLFFLILIILKWPVIPPQLPLFYSLPKGSEQLGIPWQLFLLPLLSFLFFVINFLAASIFYPEERLGSIILVIIGTISSLLLLITFIKIIFLVS